MSFDDITIVGYDEHVNLLELIQKQLSSPYSFEDLEFIPLPDNHMRAKTQSSRKYVHRTYIVDGSTLPRMIQFLTAPRERYSFQQYNFINVYLEITDASTVMTLLKQRFNTKLRTENESVGEHMMFSESMLRDIRQKVVQFLEVWISTCPEDFTNMHDIIAFERAIQQHNNLYPDYPITRYNLQSKPQIPKPPTQQAPPTLFPTRSIFTTSLGGVLDHDKVEIARQLCLLEEELFSKVKRSDLCKEAWLKSDLPSGARDCIEFSHRMKSWVICEILSRETATERALVMGKFISIAKECIKLSNFASFASVACGLNSVPVKRLKKTIRALKMAHAKKYKQIQSYASDSDLVNDMYRLDNSATAPKVPCLGVFLSQLQDLNSNGIVIELNGITMYNVRKLGAISDVIRRIREAQLDERYSFTVYPQLQDLILQTHDKYATEEEDTMYTTSLKLEM
jgi:hypothetical protein